MYKRLNDALDGKGSQNPGRPATGTGTPGQKFKSRKDDPAFQAALAKAQAAQQAANVAAQLKKPK